MPLTLPSNFGTQRRCPPSCFVAAAFNAVSRLLSTSSRRTVTPTVRPRNALSEAQRRQRRTEWKRRQGGINFLDYCVVSVKAGKGGDGCVAFHREKFMAYGPPSGGNGGRGGDVYIVPTPDLTSLSSVPTIIRAKDGEHGKGTWQNGRNAPHTIIHVPLGTVVRELTDEPHRAKTPWEEEAEKLESLQLGDEERIKAQRARRWLHYPGSDGTDFEKDAFLQAERALRQEERRRIYQARRQADTPLFLDLDRTLPETSSSPVSEDGAPQLTEHGYIVASGGNGGTGNPAFVTTDHRSPKFASRGLEGQRITLSFELKIIADVGLVGFPNAGKSTLLRAMTGGRAKSEVAGYAFTTLNPIVGVIRLDEHGDVLEDTLDGHAIEETRVEELRHAQMMESGDLAYTLTRNQKAKDQPPTALREAFRFTVADNPGLISQASENVGLGHSFLRSIERSTALVYVVDLSGPNPEEELRILRDELEKYKPGLSAKAKMVVANKADLLGGDDPDAVAEAHLKLKRLQYFVKAELRDPCTASPNQQQQPSLDREDLDVVPISAKHVQNVNKVLRLLRNYIEQERAVSVDTPSSSDVQPV